MFDNIKYHREKCSKHFVLHFDNKLEKSRGPKNSGNVEGQCQQLTTFKVPLTSPTTML